MFDEIILQNLGDSVAKPTKIDAPDHDPYSDDVDPYSVQFSDDNDPVMNDSAVVLRNQTLINVLMRNLIYLKGSFCRNRKFLVDLKT